MDRRRRRFVAGGPAGACWPLVLGAVTLSVAMACPVLRVPAQCSSGRCCIHHRPSHSTSLCCYSHSADIITTIPLLYCDDPFFSLSAISHCSIVITLSSKVEKPVQSQATEILHAHDDRFRNTRSKNTGTQHRWWFNACKWFSLKSKTATKVPLEYSHLHILQNESAKIVIWPCRLQFYYQRGNQISRLYWTGLTALAQPR